jgi:hypothetical protein
MSLYAPREDSQASFYAVFDRIVPGNNKYMATLWNGAAGRKVVLHRAWSYNWQVAAATGTELDQVFMRISARTLGTSVTPLADDTSDTLTSGITADHLTTAVTDGATIERVIVSSEEIGQTNAAFLVGSRATYPGALIYARVPGTRGVTLRNGQGISIKNVTNSNNGTVSYVYQFTDEPA